jgi:hypothetical protein
MQAREEQAAEEEFPEGTQTHRGKGVLFCQHHSRRLLRDSTSRQRRPAAATNGDFRIRNRDKKYTGPCTAALTGHSVQATVLNSQPLDNMLRVVTVVQQIMTEGSGAVTKKNSGHYQNCTKSHEPEWPLEFIGPSKS